MKLRPLGNTGMKVSEIGLGAWQLANPDWNLHDKEEALRIVHKSIEAGCNFFDTAPGYGGGRSEELLGTALKSRRHDVIICTKFSHYTQDGKRDFNIEHLRPVLEGSCKRLQTAYVDILLLHNPPRELMNGRNTYLFEEMEKLKQEGKVREYGVSLDWQVELETVIRTTKSKANEVMYNAFYQEPEGAFTEAQEKGVGLIIKVPLDSGWLSGRYNRNTHFTDIRSRWPGEILERRMALLEKLTALVQPGTSLVHCALQFILAHPQVSTIIPGAKTVEQALDNFAAADKELNPEVVNSIKRLWETEIKSAPLPW